jgi:hypothetical protein
MASKIRADVKCPAHAVLFIEVVKRMRKDKRYDNLFK